ncbi:hypothetical protein M433DRAFT_162814 [Acidomyces richmondensis BFW]|nr:MAG: hypothetical protein FE78DRAFT_467767 [Acidomyces sp. 'richmondensis']KYG49154.1 hypothetical protein M433DRAFT_162814 [Acidomyces richmondensis BFW]
MSVTRACGPCRAGKTKCDMNRPICGRCAQRRIACHGYLVQPGLIFCDQREVAQRNSERARKKFRQATTLLELIGINPPREQRPSNTSFELSDLDLQQYYSWLSSRAVAPVSEPLRRDLCERAVEHFFVNWTVYPSNDEQSPGFLHTLPQLYSQASPNSALSFAVRAIAAADKRHYHDGKISFHTKARLHYGEALARLRVKANDEQVMTEDCTLATLMLLDSFEEMYLARSEPLGPHSDAVSHILHLRGDAQFFDRSKYALWRMAYDRLQAKQILLREGPSSTQIEWFTKLDTSTPNFRICADKLRMNILCAEAKKLLERNQHPKMALTRAQQLIQDIQALLSSIDGWKIEMPTALKPQHASLDQMEPRMSQSCSISSFLFTCSKALAYRDISIANIWNFYTAGQIVLRESLIEVLEYAAALQQEDNIAETRSKIEIEQIAIQALAGNIIESSPQLLGFIPAKGGNYPLQQGIMAGRFLILFSMWVIQRAKHTSRAHKRISTEIVDWIKHTHALA